MPSPDLAAWATIDDIPEAVVEEVGIGLPEWYRVLSLATDVLWGATGRRWRGRSMSETVTLRAAPPQNDSGRRWPYDTSWGFCSCVGGALPAVSARHSQPTRVRLPRRDVTAVTAVTIDGDPFTAFRLGGSWLTRTDGSGWPMCGERTQITYSFGRVPPLAGKQAVVEFAIEIAKAMSGQACSLPKRLTSVTRQGISFAALDDLEFLSEGLTGVYGIDVWIRAVNPDGRKQAATVWSPDIATATRS